jgi:hypothetical protein
MPYLITAAEDYPVLLFVSLAYADWAGEDRIFGNVHLIVRPVSSFTNMRTTARGFNRRFKAVVLAPTHGANDYPQLMWDDNWTQTSSSINAVQHLSDRIHVLACWQGLFLQDVAIPRGLVVSAYKVIIDGEGEDEEGSLLQTARSGLIARTVLTA